MKNQWRDIILFFIILLIFDEMMTIDKSLEINCASTDGTTTLSITTFSTTLSITIKIATLSIMAFNVVILSVLCWVSQISRLCRVSSCWVLWRHRDIWICKNINFHTSAFKFKSFVCRHHYNNFWSLKRNYSSKPSVYAAIKQALVKAFQGRILLNIWQWK